jgi:hypothetical protein
MRRHALWTMLGLLALAPAHPALAGDFHPTRAPAPPSECEAKVAYDRDMVLPGYILPTSAGPRTCVPFSSARAHPPEGYKGDYYVDEFTDAKLRKAWEACRADTTCHDRVFKQVMARHPPNKEYALTDPHVRYLLGKIDETADVDLKTIRRPAFFAQAPYHESFAAADDRTYTVEFTAPPEPYERIHKQMTADIKLRGWYTQGAGIDDGKGGKVRALVIMSGGGGSRLVAIDDPSDHQYRTDPATGNTVLNDFPNATTGAQGQALWRLTADILNKAGFDVLSIDRRGVGVSGGYSDTNTLQQGRDLLAMVASLRTGKGMRALSPAGETLKGYEAATAIHGGKPDAGQSVFFLGSSRGTMSSGWAMTLNYDKDCTYDLPTITCKGPVGDKTIRGAILISEFSSGVGYLPSQTTAMDDGRGPGRDRGLFIGGIEAEHNIVFFPSSAILAGMKKWPSAFFARGLWCYADGLEGTMDSYSRVKGPKEVVVVRGPHQYETWPAEEKKRVQDRMIAYAKAVTLGQSTIPGGRPWSDMKQLVATTSDAWEESTHPTTAP